MELCATLLGNHARNARDAGIHICTSPGRPTQHTRTQPTPGTQPAPHSTPERSTPPRIHGPPHTAPPNAAPHLVYTARPTQHPTHTARHAAPHARCPSPERRAPASSHGDRGRGRGRLSRRARAYSLTPPAVRPETMYFCRYWKSRMTGMAARTAPAAKMPHGAVRSSAAHMYMPTASVN